MKLTELKSGDIFTIEDTPTYPKLKISGGYVDIRDEIINKRGNCDHREVSILSAADIVKAFDDEYSESDIEDWMASVRIKWAHLL